MSHCLLAPVKLRRRLRQGYCAAAGTVTPVLTRLVGHDGHQERVGRMRSPPIDNKWIGMRMTDPDIDLVTLAQAQGAQGFGPVRDAAELAGIFAAAITAVQAGAVAVVDVRVQPGYTPAMASALTRSVHNDPCRPQDGRVRLSLINRRQKPSIALSSIQRTAATRSRARST